MFYRCCHCTHDSIRISLCEHSFRPFTIYFFYQNSPKLISFISERYYADKHQNTKQGHQNCVHHHHCQLISKHTISHSYYRSYMPVCLRSSPPHIPALAAMSLYKTNSDFTAPPTAPRSHIERAVTTEQGNTHR